jgi:hypothetical protein
MSEKKSRLDEYRGRLIIDRDDLDTALQQQPELFYHVADALVQAVAERDACKLELEEALAREDKSLRVAAAKTDGKLTEAAIRQQLALVPVIQDLERELLDLKRAADSWQALKEGYTQRSYMLRELVGMYLSRLSSGSMSGPRADISDAHHEKQAELRRNRRGR